MPNEIESEISLTRAYKRDLWCEAHPENAHILSWANIILATDADSHYVASLWSRDSYYSGGKLWPQKMQNENYLQRAFLWGPREARRR
jgi:hypothetical protein